MRAPFPAMTGNNTAKNSVFRMLADLFTTLDADSTTTVKRPLLPICLIFYYTFSDKDA